MSYKRFTKKRKLNGRIQVYNSDLDIWIFLDLMIDNDDYDQDDYDYCDARSFTESEILQTHSSDEPAEMVEQSEPETVETESVSSISEYESSDSGSCDSGGDSGD